MTTTTITRLKHDIEAARSRGDLVAVARLRSEIPLDQRNEWDAMNGHLSITAAGRGYSLAPARVVGELARPAARTSLTHAPGAQSVAITSSVRNSLDDSFDGAEVGGFLIGPVQSDSDEIVVTGAIATGGDDMVRTSTSTTLDLHRAIRIWDTLPADETLIGDHHCHPPDSSSQPSSQDIASWERLSEFFGKPWLGIVSRNVPTRVPGINGRLHDTSELELVATLVRRDSYGRFEHRQIEISTRS